MMWQEHELKREPKLEIARLAAASADGGPAEREESANARYRNLLLLLMTKTLMPIYKDLSSLQQ